MAWNNFFSAIQVRLIQWTEISFSIIAIVTQRVNNQHYHQQDQILIIWNGKEFVWFPEINDGVSTN